MSASRSGGLAHTAPLFAALGDKTRLALVVKLSSDGPHSITQLAAGSRLTRQGVTKHLNVLAKAGLVRHSRRGREHVWEFKPEGLDDAHRYLDQVSRRWGEALDRLRTLVET